MRGNPEISFENGDVDLEQNRKILLGEEHSKQRDILASYLALEFRQTQDKYRASLPEKFDLDPVDSPLFPAIIDPRTNLERLLEITGVTANIDAQATKDLKEVVTPKTPYVIRAIVNVGKSFDAALSLKNNPSFRGATAVEGAIWSLFNNSVMDENPIYLPGSRMDEIWMPYIRKTKEGKTEMSSDLPIERKGQGELKFLLVAR